MRSSRSGSGSAMVGCGGDTIDANDVEAGIEESLSTATASVSSVSCPDDVDKEEGATFTFASRPAAERPATSARPPVEDAPIIGPPAEPAIELIGVAENETPDGVSRIAIISALGGELFLVKEGEKVTCTATGAGGRESQLTFTFSSADGTIDESSVSGSGG